MDIEAFGSSQINMENRDTLARVEKTLNLHVLLVTENYKAIKKTLANVTLRIDQPFAGIGHRMGREFAAINLGIESSRKVLLDTTSELHF